MMKKWFIVLGIGIIVFGVDLFLLQFYTNLHGFWFLMVTLAGTLPIFCFLFMVFLSAQKTDFR